MILPYQSLPRANSRCVSFREEGFLRNVWFVRSSEFRDQVWFRLLDWNAMRLLNYLLVFACGVCALPVKAIEPAGEAKAEVSFFKDVMPIFRKNNCTGCHQPAKQGGDYVMTEFAALLKGGESSSAAVVPRQPGKSYLIEQITPAGGKAAMPKDAPPLSETDIATIR